MLFLKLNRSIILFFLSFDTLPGKKKSINFQTAKPQSETVFLQLGRGVCGQEWGVGQEGSATWTHTGPQEGQAWTQERRWVAPGVHVGNSLSHNHSSEKLCGLESQT